MELEKYNNPEKSWCKHRKGEDKTKVSKTENEKRGDIVGVRGMKDQNR